MAVAVAPPQRLAHGRQRSAKPGPTASVTIAFAAPAASFARSGAIVGADRGEVGSEVEEMARYLARDLGEPRERPRAGGRKLEDGVRRERSERGRTPGQGSASIAVPADEPRDQDPAQRGLEQHPLGRDLVQEVDRLLVAARAPGPRASPLRNGSVEMSAQRVFAEL